MKRQKFIRGIVFPVIFILPLLFCNGCSYQMGSMMHPQIKSIAIAPVKNNSREVLASDIMRKLLAERFMFDGSLKLTSMEKADCIVYCQINSVSQRAIAWDEESEEDRPSEFQLSVTGEFVVMMPGHAAPLIKKRQVRGSCTYQFLTDPAVGKENGLVQACLQMANMVVQYTTEAW